MKQQSPRTKRLENPWAATLRRIGDNIQRRKFDKALSESNELLSQPEISLHKKSRVLALVADSEFKRGHYAEAAEIQLQAATKNMDHPMLWLRPYIGYVRALLKAPQVEQALVMARHAVAMAETKMGEFDEQVRLADQALAANIAVEAPPVPVRISVVATRLGYLFLQEGEPEAAEEFFQKAIQHAKGGANRARQGLAMIAMSKGEFAEAAEISAEAIRKGHFRVKTLPAWSIHISARRQLGCWRIGDRLIKGLDAAQAGLRARTIFAIVSELRRNGMRQWRKVAEEWMAKEGVHFPQYERDIRKLILASAKLDGGNASSKREAAERLLRMSELGARDWLSAAKEYVRAGLLEGLSINLDHLLLDAKNRFGKEFVPQAAHRLALSCMIVKRSDMARTLLQTSIEHSRPGHAQWAKSLWALARMEKELANHPESAQAYRRFFEAKGIPARFCLQAQLHWAQQMILAGNPDAFWEAHALMTKTLEKIQNPEILMNFARQLLFGPPELRQWGQEVYLQGEALALTQFNEAAHPAMAMDILFKLTRRQVVDFDRSASAISFWESMNEGKKDWLWSNSSVFWEYLGCLFTAYLRVKDSVAAEEFATSFLNDPASPASGLPYIGIPFAKYLINSGRSEEGLAICEKMANGAPRLPRCAWAWYWKALEALICGRTDKSKDLAQNIRTAQGLQPGTLDEWKLDARARLLLADLNITQVDLQGVKYTRSFAEEQLAQISSDLRRLK